MTKPGKILFYDGECGFCNRSVQTALRADKKGELRFAPLQGETAVRTLPESLRQPDQLGTMVLFDADGTIKTRSDAALEVARTLGGLWKTLLIGRILPRPFRDGIYNFIARNRQRLPSQKACDLPDAETRRRFLP